MKTKKDWLISQCVHKKKVRRRPERKPSWMNKLEILHAGNERRTSCTSQSNGCFDPVVVEHLFPLKQHRRGSRSKPFTRSSTKDLRGFMKFQPLRCARQEERKEEKRTKRSKHKEQPVAKWVHQRQVGAIKGFRLVLFFILLGFRMQTVNAVEEISIRQEVDNIIETVRSNRCKRMEFCNREWREGREAGRQGPKNF